MVSIVLITSLSILAIVCLPNIITRADQEDNQQSAEHQSNVINMKAFFQNTSATKEFIKSENKTLIQLLKVINLESCKVFDVSQRRRNNLFFMQCLIDVHLGYPKALLWLKKHLNLQACDVILGDWHHSPNATLEKMTNSFSTQHKRFYKYFGSFKIINFITKSISISFDPVKRLLLVIVAYLDLIFDAILLFSIIIVLGPISMWNPDTFSSQVGFILLASVIFPFLKSTVTLANKRPEVVLDSNSWIKWKARSHENYSRNVVWPLKIFIFVFSPLVPAVLVFSSEKAKDKQKLLINKNYQEEEESFHTLQRI